MTEAISCPGCGVMIPAKSEACPTCNQVFGKREAPKAEPKVMPEAKPEPKPAPKPRGRPKKGKK